MVNTMINNFRNNDTTTGKHSAAPAAAISRLIRGSLISAILLLNVAPALAQDAYQKAEQQLKSGDISGMAESYLKILKNNPRDVKARIGYATANSWLGKHELAQRQFNDVLSVQPENLEALSGLGYDLAWDDRFFEAEQQFKKAQLLAPDNAGIEKGLAFTYLWGKQPRQALNVLRSLESKSPDDAEILAAKGQALAALGRKDEAANAFSAALKIQPGREDALNGLAAMQPEKTNTIFHISAWYGKTSGVDDSGLRELELAYSLENKSRIWFRFDDSLSLDNPALARSGESAETLYLGIQSALNPTWQGIFEIGNRDLPANADQQIYKFEAINFQAAQVYKLGVQISPHSNDYTDKLVYTGFGYAMNRSWRVEPALFLSSSGAIDDKEVRAVVFAEYVDPQKWSLGVGAGVGQITSDNTPVEGTVLTSNALFSYPLNPKTNFKAAVRYEDSPTNSFSTVLIGIAVQLP
jgi:Flp pilus assembly protein TadD